MDDKGLNESVSLTDVNPAGVLVLGGATHLVQMVEIEVRVTVDVVVVTSSTA